MNKLGMVGLGLLGSALAERFLRAGFDVVGCDLDPQRRHHLVEMGGSAVPGIADLVDVAERIVLCLPTSETVAGVVDELVKADRFPKLLLDTTTGDPVRTELLAGVLRERGVAYVDATVSGSSEQARAGDVIVMAGGEPTAVRSCSDLFAAFAREWFHVGPNGSGARMKLVTNLVLGLNRAVLAEGLAFAEACGLNASEALRVLRVSAACSRVMDIKGQKMLERDFTPQARLAQHLKDVGLIQTEGARVSAKLPLTQLHRDLLEQLVQAGWGGADNSAILNAFLVSADSNAGDQDSLYRGNADPRSAATRESAAHPGIDSAG